MLERGWDGNGGGRGGDEVGTRGEWGLEPRAAPTPPSPAGAADSDGTPGQGPPSHGASAPDGARDKGSFSPHLDRRLWAELGAVSTPHPTSGSAAPRGAGGSALLPPRASTSGSTAPGGVRGTAPPLPVPHLDPRVRAEFGAVPPTPAPHLDPRLQEEFGAVPSPPHSPPGPHLDPRRGSAGSCRPRRAEARRGERAEPSPQPSGLPGVQRPLPRGPPPHRDRAGGREGGGLLRGGSGQSLVSPWRWPW